METLSPFNLRGSMYSLGKFFPLGISLIFIGIALLMVASILSIQPSGGIVIIFPFIYMPISGAAAITIIILFFAISLAVLFLPWILGSKRIDNIIEKVVEARGEERSETERGSLKGKVEDYLITLKMSGFREEDISVKVINKNLVVEAFKDGSVFKRRYKIPEGFKVEGVKYNYENGFLIIKATLKRRGEE